MKEFKIPNFNEQVLVCRSLIVAAKNISGAMETFIQWIIAGVGAGLTYLLGQRNSTFEQLRPAILIYVCALVLGVGQRYLAMLVSVGTQAFQEAEKLPDEKKPIDLARYFILYITAQPRLSRWAAAKVAVRFINGDVITTGRNLLMLAIGQCILALVICVFLTMTFFYALRAL